MIFLTRDQMLSILRTLLKIAGTALAAHGVGNIAGWEIISGAILTVVPVVWDMFVHSDAGVVKAAENNASITQVVINTDKASNAVLDAAADPNRPKVVSQ